MNLYSYQVVTKVMIYILIYIFGTRSVLLTIAAAQQAKTKLTK